MPLLFEPNAGFDDFGDINLQSDHERLLLLGLGFEHVGIHLFHRDDISLVDGELAGEDGRLDIFGSMGVYRADFLDLVPRGAEENGGSFRALPLIGRRRFRRPGLFSLVEGGETAHQLGVRQVPAVPLGARGFIKECGKEDSIGHPTLYKTTDEFLDYFGLATKADLPKLDIKDKPTLNDEVELYESNYKEEVI